MPCLQTLCGQAAPSATPKHSAYGGAGLRSCAAIDLLYGSFYYRLLLGAGILDERFVDAANQQFMRGHGTRVRGPLIVPLPGHLLIHTVLCL